MKFLQNLFSSGAKGILDPIGDIIETFVESPEKKLELKRALMDHERKVQEEFNKGQNDILKDKQSARIMGQADPWTPRILTILFTAGYFGITFFMFSIVMKMFNQDMNDFVVSFISSIFGAFNAIMVQIISYYFGASKGGDDHSSKIAESFKESVKKK